MEQRNEPTTAEIVKETRLCSQPDWNCDKCSRNGMPFGDCFTELYLQAADRLEQLERENVRLMTENKALHDHIMIATGAAGHVDEYAPVMICGVPLDDAIKMLVEYPAIKEQLAAEKARADAAVDVAVRAVLVEIMGRLKSLANYTPPCSFCAHENGERTECKSCYENGNFKYRGAQERGKGTE